MEFDYNNLLWDILRKHINHRVHIRAYGNYEIDHDICLECDDCGEVILDAGIYTICAREDE